MGAEPDGLLAGRYEVGALVGLGGTARVHSAWDHDRDRRVAVKIFRSGSAPAPGYGGERELEVLGGLSHPGVVGVQDSGVDAEGCPFVVMDFVEGRSLAERRSDGPLPAAAVARLGAALADALAVVHARGVVHRDVKPANVLLDTEGHPWLTDFGIARIVDATRVTATGVVVGTAAYMAPEQVRGETVGPPADVYALGLVLLETLTGRREYEGNALESALARLHRAPVVPAEAPDPLAATLRRMTALDPGERPSATDVAAALRGTSAPIAARRPAARAAAPVAALAALVAAVVTGALTLSGTPTAGAPAPVVAAAPPLVPPVPETTSGAAPEVPLVPAEPPVPVALTSHRNPPVRSTPTPTRGSGDDRADRASDDRSGDPTTDDRHGDDRHSDDRRGPDRSDRDDDGDHASDAHEDGDERVGDLVDDVVDDVGKAVDKADGKDKDKKDKNKDEKDDDGHDKGGHSGSDSGKD